MELCIQNLTSNWFNFVVCVDQNYQQIPDNTASCAAKINLATDQINKCANTDLGKQLMLDSIHVHIPIFCFFFF